MADITHLVERVVREQLANKLGLITLEVKELREANQELQKKNALLAKRVRGLEEVIRERPDETDFGV